MNRTQKTIAIVWLDQLAAKAKDEAAKLRAQLDEDARGEYQREGVAASWRVPEIATVSSSVSKSSVVVENEAAFREWVKSRYPDAIQTIESVRQGWQQRFLDLIEVVDGALVDPGRGEIVPGIKTVPGGRFLGISVRATTEAKHILGAAAHVGLRRAALDAGPNAVTVLAELEPADAEG